ncbi:MAG: hypothetical protein PHW22_04360 [Bacilli bacterium]|nr:hypothetical protein [Bacilli bacterium]
MILILGTSDDILIYLRNVIRYSKVEKVNNMKVNIGKIYGQDVAIANIGISNYRTEVISGFLINKYNPYIVISLSDAMKLTAGSKIGDSFLGSQIGLVDIDQMERLPDQKLNTVPGFPQYLSVSPTLIKLFNDCSAQVNVLSAEVGTILSSNNYAVISKNLSFDVKDYQAVRREEIVFDSDVGGVGLTCHFYDVPLFPLVCISHEVDNKESFVERNRVLLRTAMDLGKIVVSFIVSISSNENHFIRSDEYAAKDRF